MTGTTRPRYEDLMKPNAAVDPFDRHVFACLLVAAGAEAPRPLPQALGLDGTAIKALVGRFFPGTRLPIPEGSAEGSPEPDAPEEPDLRALLLEHRAGDALEEAWLAAIIARRSLRPNHLWQDLGLRSRQELSDLLRRHFPSLFHANDKNMKWKKFFYRTLCQREGVLVCKSPQCEACCDYLLCFDASVP